ncbi:MAG TPA: carboxypeptidase-like regulatory domain-containing protein, partial [Pyrinomonadaceae bacterium]
MRIPIYAALLIFFISGLGAAQQSVTSGTLSGRIEDTQGAVVSGVTVTATHLETNHQQTTTSDVEGRYRFPYLRTGDYDLKVEADGFESMTKQLTVMVGQALDLP